MDALKDVDFYIKEEMSKRHIDRDRAINNVWRRFGQMYRQRGYEIETWQDVYTRWLDEKVSPPESEED